MDEAPLHQAPEQAPVPANEGLLRPILVSIGVSAVVTAVSALSPDKYAATAVGVCFLAATWALVLRKDAETVRAFDGDAMTRDTIFRIYSMTKPITSVATLMLYEEGKLRLTDPVSMWIPELAQPRVLREPNGALDAVEPSPREITVRD